MSTGAAEGEEEIGKELRQDVWSKAREAGKKLKGSGLPTPGLVPAGSGLFMTLSNWGLLPQASVLQDQVINHD